MENRYELNGFFPVCLKISVIFAKLMSLWDKPARISPLRRKNAN